MEINPAKELMEKIYNEIQKQQKAKWKGTTFTYKQKSIQKYITN